MYRVFCLSYGNYVKQYGRINNDECCCKNEYRYEITRPFELILDIERYKLEHSRETLLYKQLSDLLFYMACNSDRYPKSRAFLWTLEARGIKGQYYGVVPQYDLEEQTKLVNMFLSLQYWV